MKVPNLELLSSIENVPLYWS